VILLNAKTFKSLIKFAFVKLWQVNDKLIVAFIGKHWEDKGLDGESIGIHWICQSFPRSKFSTVRTICSGNNMNFNWANHGIKFVVSKTCYMVMFEFYVCFTLYPTRGIARPSVMVGLVSYWLPGQEPTCLQSFSLIK